MTAAARHPAPEVRPATPADLEPIAALHTAARAAYLRGRVPDAPFDTAAEHARCRDTWTGVLHRADTLALCAVRGGTVIGAAAYRHRVRAAVQLHQLHVDPAHWGTGAGRALHAACLHAWRTAGCSRAVLDVLWHNHRARAFYARLGWHPDPERRPAPDATHLALTLPLDPPAPAAP
ncbi:GNAT family N-acetyltransferase [Streptomyces sp. RS10V-4]|uniref:GNAT family N-acetyltransferase n=1 Tax=Streptomyces rhizoryzae TaxID=2932493 RepID=UPI0020053CFD|nr:GNAT family N-acetyltransferase [Streptomyces rhizoryzae]MCK7621945.1 GNAT family N-acetyltransferase [Streptomyces rhizoryzae]